MLLRAAINWTIPTPAYRNLVRGSQFQLPSGQNVARALGKAALSDDQL